MREKWKAKLERKAVEWEKMEEQHEAKKYASIAGPACSTNAVLANSDSDSSSTNEEYHKSITSKMREEAWQAKLERVAVAEREKNKEEEQQKAKKALDQFALRAQVEAAAVRKNLKEREALIVGLVYVFDLAPSFGNVQSNTICSLITNSFFSIV
jgi:hypothetical protein